MGVSGSMLFIVFFIGVFGVMNKENFFLSCIFIEFFFVRMEKCDYMKEKNKLVERYFGI